MKTPHNHSALSPTALVRDLDDTALRSGHALLDTQRARDFALWIDSRLEGLEIAFHRFSTPQSLRRSLGR